MKPKMRQILHRIRLHKVPIYLTTDIIIYLHEQAVKKLSVKVNVTRIQ